MAYHPPGKSAESDPLYADIELFNKYMESLDLILAKPEIRDSLREFSLSPAFVRMAMVADAGRILGSARREFAAYQQVHFREFGGPAADPRLISHGSRRDADSLMRLWLAALAALGALCAAAGLAWMQAWHWGGAWAAVPAWAGGAMLVVAAVVWAGWRYADWAESSGTLPGILKSQSSPQLDAARLQLMAAVSGAELLAHVRALINDVRQDRFGYEFSVTSSPGLSARHDNLNRILTATESELDQLIERLDGASIGVAGARGSGKSTLVHKYCEQASPDDDADDGTEADWWSLLAGMRLERPARDVQCMVAAPVNYVAQDFVLHLFAVFCQVVIDNYGSSNEQRNPYVAVLWIGRARNLLTSLLWRAVFYGGPAAVLLLDGHAVARKLLISPAWAEYSAITLAVLGALAFLRSARWKIRWWTRTARSREGKSIVASARAHLNHIRFLLTVTSGWSVGLPLPRSASAQFTRAVARAEQPLSYPEIVNDFTNFARTVASDVRRRGDRVFIGVDELDKIGSPEQAEQFLNEIKGIFGIPSVYFIVSVSDDALTAFERRGLPLRDAFDSSFDEIIHVGPLSYVESRKLLYRRVIGLSEPYVGLCHCLAGGLARDVIRAARLIVHTGAILQAANPAPASANPYDREDREAAIAYLAGGGRIQERPKPTLSAVAAAVIQSELRRKLRATTHVVGRVASEQASDTQDALHEAGTYLQQERPIIDVLDLLGKPAPEEPAALTPLRIDAAAYAYFCATLQDVFSSRLDRTRMIEATSESGGHGTFDALAAARNAFAVDTHLAWRLISQFRTAWSLDAHEPPR